MPNAVQFSRLLRVSWSWQGGGRVTAVTGAAGPRLVAAAGRSAWWPGNHARPRPRFEPAARLSGHRREQHVDGGLVLGIRGHLLRTKFVRCIVAQRRQGVRSGTEAAHLEQARDQQDERNLFVDGFAESLAVLGCPSLLRRLAAKPPKSPACHAVTVLSLRTVPFAGDVVALVAVERHRRHGGTNSAECHQRGRARNSAAESRWLPGQCERAESRGRGM